MTSDPPRHGQDLELVRSALRAEPGAVDRIVRRLACIPPMVRARHARIGSPLSPEDLDDVIQSTMSTVWSRLASYEGRARFETWLYGFCVLELLQGLGKKRREALVKSAGDDPLLTAAAAAPESDPSSYEHLHACLARLETECSTVIQLKHFADLSFTRIGRLLDSSPNTVKSQYYRGLRQLEVWLRPILRAEER